MDIDAHGTIAASLFGLVGGSVDVVEPIVDGSLWSLKGFAYFAGATIRTALIVNLVKRLVLLVIVFYASFKLFITLITTYLKIFINVISAPFQMLMGAIPGNTNQITNWFKSVVANTLVFVGVFITINVFSIISKTVDPNAFNFFGTHGAIWPEFLISLQGVITIAGYLFAASMPKIINGALGVGANKSLMGAGDDMAKSVKKIPVVGGMFN